MATGVAFQLLLCAGASGCFAICFAGSLHISLASCVSGYGCPQSQFNVRNLIWGEELLLNEDPYQLPYTRWLCDLLCSLPGTSHYLAALPQLGNSCYHTASDQTLVFSKLRCHPTVERLRDVSLSLSF